MKESKLIQALRKAIEKGEEEGYYCVGLIEQLEAELERKDGEISSLKIQVDTCRGVKKYELEQKDNEIARLASVEREASIERSSWLNRYL